MARTRDLYEYSPEVLVKKIQQEFPDILCKHWEFIDEGWDHAVLLVDSLYAFRFPRDAEYSELLLSEIPLLAEIKPQVHANIPEYSRIAHDKSFAGYLLVPGHQLKPELLSKLTHQDRQSVARQLAEFLTSLHAFHPSDEVAKRVAVSYLKDEQEELKQGISQHLQNILSTQELERIDSILEQVQKLISRDLPQVFTHSDIYPGHLLWDENTKKLGVIDFSDRCFNDPAVDFAELYEYSDTFVQEVYSYYTGVRTEDFLERAWVYQQWVGVFLMVDHFINHKTSFAIARETFDRTATQKIST